MLHWAPSISSQFWEIFHLVLLELKTTNNNQHTLDLVLSNSSHKNFNIWDISFLLELCDMICNFYSENKTNVGRKVAVYQPTEKCETFTGEKWRVWVISSINIFRSRSLQLRRLDLQQDGEGLWESVWKQSILLRSVLLCSSVGCLHLPGPGWM